MSAGLRERFSEVVLAAGKELVAMRGSASTQGVWYGSQLKTPADETMHKFLVANLRDIAPDIAVISEEDIATQGCRRPDRYWLIDPIDGTASFSGGFSGFVTQVALMESSRPVLAAIYAPALELFYRAERGRGATLNGIPLSAKPRVGRRIMVDNYPEPRGVARTMYDALECTGYVESGSIALKICRVADGTADIFFKAVTVRDWDVAPAQLVLQEAGGYLCDLHAKAFVYRGSFDKTGLIAANSAALRRAAISCHSCIDQKPISSTS